MEEHDSSLMSDNDHRALIESIIRCKADLFVLPPDEKRALISIIKQETKWCNEQIESANKELKLYSDFYDMMKSLKEKQ